MKKLLYIFLIMALSGCASKSVTKQDRNEILIDDLYKINKSLTQRLGDLESQIKFLKKSRTGISDNHEKNRKTSFRVKGKTHEMNESVYYGKTNSNSKSLPQFPPKQATNKPRKKKYSQMAKELDLKIAAKNNDKEVTKKIDNPTMSIDNKGSPNKNKKNQVSMQRNPVSEDSDENFSPIEKFDAATFRTTNNVQLVDEQNQATETWVSGTSFTAKEKWGEYYKVSGYFVNKQWTRAESTLLLPIDQAIER